MNLNYEPGFILPHIRYFASQSNHNPSHVYKKYMGNDDGLTNGKVYKFHYSLYSPNRETKYKEYLVTHNDNESYIKYEDNKGHWVNMRKPK